MQASDTAIRAFNRFVRHQDFPCVGAKSALATGGMKILVAGGLHESRDDAGVLAFLRSTAGTSTGLVSKVALFPETPALSEAGFEQVMWQRLQALHDQDCQEFLWDPRVSSDPSSPDFSMSVGGIGYYVVGLHPAASRAARRAPMAMLAFNPHHQFEQLRADGKYSRVQKIVQARDIILQGNINPMLAEHGTVSEAAQYSGRAVGANWVCPFETRKAGPHAG
jgi:uncharacterized protein